MTEQHGSHSFSMNDALKYGIHAAVLLNNIRFWVATNKANKSSYHYHDGLYWTYNSRRAYSELMPYLSTGQIRNAITKLLDAEVIISGSFNKKGYDKTLWYTMTPHDTAQQPSTPLPASCVTSNQPCVTSNQPCVTSNQPIPDINTDINTDINLKNGNLQKDVDILLKIPDPKPTAIPSENKEEKLKDAKKSGDKKTIISILEKSKFELQEKAEACDYLYGLTTYQLTHPKEFKNSTYKKKKLTRIASDVYTLYRYWYMLGNPDAGMLPETTFKDIAMVNRVLKHLNGNIMLFRDVVVNWNVFRTAVEATHKTKVKPTTPNIAIMIKYAVVASSEEFMDKVGVGNIEDTWEVTLADI